MGSSSPGLPAFEDSTSSSHDRRTSDSDSNDEDDPIHLNIDHSVLDDDPLDEQVHSP